MKATRSLFLLAFTTSSLFAATPHPLSSSDPAEGRAAIASYVEKGEKVLPQLRLLAKSNDPRIRTRAKEAIGGITGHWGSEVDLIWKRKMSAATNQGKPIMMLHLFGNLNEEFC